MVVPTASYWCVCVCVCEYECYGLLFVFFASVCSTQSIMKIVFEHFAVKATRCLCTYTLSSNQLVVSAISCHVFTDRERL